METKVDGPATLVDVAAAAGVSLATASRAINGHRGVHPRTRARVLEEAARLRFQPLHAARTLRRRHANVIGVIVPDISSVFYASLVRGAEHVLQGLALEGNWSQEAGYPLMSTLLSHPTPATAVVVASHDMVVGALLALRAADKRIPRDMAIVCFDDTSAGAVLDPPLTALTRRDYEVGRHAAELLLTRLGGAGQPGRCEIRLPMHLVVRQSCGCGG